MKILFVSFYFKPDLCAGSFRAAAIAEELSKRNINNFEVDIITTVPNRYESYEAKQNLDNQMENINIHRVKIPSHQNGFIDQSICFLFFFIGALKFTRNKDYDLILATSSRLMTAFLAAFLSKIKNVKLYLDIRDIFLEIISEVLPKIIIFFLYPILYLIERFTFSKASIINLVSYGFKDYLIKRYPQKKLSFHMNGIDDIFLEFDFEKKQTNKPLNILYAGNVGPGQALEKILPEIAMNSEFNITVIGDGNSFNKLKKIKDKKNIKNLTLIPPIARNELLERYREADLLFLHLNNLEPLKKVIPSKIFEYAATNKPIIAGVSGEAKYFLEKNIESSFVFDPFDYKQAINIIRNLKFFKIDRDNFNQEYSRNRLVSKMCDEIIDFLEHEKG